MILTQVPRDGQWGHVNGFPLNKLPGELRLMIYQMIFAGSKKTFKYTGPDNDRCRRFSNHSRFITTKHFDFLLTCRAAYYDALPSYWSNTTIYVGEYISGSRPHNSSFGYKYVASQLSAVARENITCLENVLDPGEKHLRSFADRMADPDIRFYKFLLMFPRLRECILSPLHAPSFCEVKKIANCETAAIWTDRRLELSEVYQEIRMFQFRRARQDMNCAKVAVMQISSKFERYLCRLGHESYWDDPPLRVPSDGPNIFIDCSGRTLHRDRCGPVRPIQDRMMTVRNFTTGRVLSAFTECYTDEEFYQKVQAVKAEGEDEDVCGSTTDDWKIHPQWPLSVYCRMQLPLEWNEDEDDSTE